MRTRWYGSATTTSSEIRRRPENVLRVATFEVWSFPSEESTGDPFQAVDQRRYRVLGWVVHQQMNVVYLAIHLDQLGLEILAHFVEDQFQPMESVGVKGLFAILGDEDQVNVELENTMSTAPNITRQLHRPMV